MSYDFKLIADRLYDAYGKVTDKKNLMAHQMPEFKDLPETVNKAWVGTAIEACNIFTTPRTDLNPYEIDRIHSLLRRITNVTYAIEELKRNEAAFSEDAYLTANKSVQSATINEIILICTGQIKINPPQGVDICLGVGVSTDSMLVGEPISRISEDRYNTLLEAEKRVKELEMEVKALSDFD